MPVSPPGLTKFTLVAVTGEINVLPIIDDVETVCQQPWSEQAADIRFDQNQGDLPIR